MELKMGGGIKSSAASDSFPAGIAKDLHPPAGSWVLPCWKPSRSAFFFSVRAFFLSFQIFLWSFSAAWPDFCPVLNFFSVPQEAAPRRPSRLLQSPPPSSSKATQGPRKLLQDPSQAVGPLEAPPRPYRPPRNSFRAPVGSPQDPLGPQEAPPRPT